MDKALETMINNMPEKTGKSLEEWINILKKENFDKHSVAVKYLKTEHGVTHGFANTIVALSKEQQDSTEDLVSNQYSGKESLKPIYDKLITIVKGLGKDVTISPKKTSVSIIRKHQFVLIKPATKTRIDLGLKLKGVELQGCLEASGPFGSMCSHRIQLKAPEDIDKEVMGWIEKAYEMSI